MSRFYVACDLGKETGGVFIGTLHKDNLVMSEVRSFANTPVQDKDALCWNIPQLYQELLDALQSVGAYDEPIDAISCTSWAGDYLLFDTDGSLITPAFHYADPRTAAGKKQILSKMTPEALYEETGLQPDPANTLFQLAADSKRLKRAGFLLPIADGFNFLLSGVPKMELSQASQTQLFNPVINSWSETLLNLVRLHPKMLPPIVNAGTELGPLREELRKETRLEEAKVIASCSESIAATIAGLPVAEGEDWAFMRPGQTTLLGMQLSAPSISQSGRDLGFSNEVIHQGAVCFHKYTLGLSILDECQRAWKATDREIDADLLSHLAGSATPFESLIDPSDARFQTPGDMPQKIQAYCKETGQEVPRRPGPIFRCILESLALWYRKSLRELELITGCRFARLFLLGKTGHPLLNHFIANAVQLPTLIIDENATALGNIVVQALTLGHIQSPELARAILRSSLKAETIIPYATAWDAAYERLFVLATSTAAE